MFELASSRPKHWKRCLLEPTSGEPAGFSTFCPVVPDRVIPKERLIQQGALTEYKIVRAQTNSLDLKSNPPVAADLDLRVLEIEAARAATFHPGVDLETLVRWKELSEDAQVWGFRNLLRRSHGFDNHEILLGTTSRVVDHIVTAEGLKILIQAVYKDTDANTRAEKLESLKRAIENGPPEGMHSEEDAILWSTPQTPEELVAGIVRSGLLGGGDKRRMRVSPELRLWIQSAFSEVGYAPRSSLGGYAAHGTQLALAHFYLPTMLSLWKYPTSLYESSLLPKETAIIADRKDCHTIADLRPDELVASGGHYCFSLGNSGDKFLPEELSGLVVDGQTVNLETPHRIEVIVSGSHAEPGFGDRDENEMRAIGRAHKLMCLASLQYYETLSAAQKFFRQLAWARQEGTPCALEYSEPKPAARPIEVQMLRMMMQTKACDIIAMNTSEAFGLVERLIDTIEGGENLLEISVDTQRRMRAALELAEVHETQWGDGREDPRWIADCALLLQEIFDLPLVRVRGMWADVTICGRYVEIDQPEEIRRALFFSRDQANVKVANASGSIRSLADQAWVWSSPTGQCVAAAAVVNDHLRTSFAPRDLLTESLMNNGYAQLSDGRRLFFALTKPMLVTDGGTTSAGDTMSIILATGILPQLKEAAVARLEKAEAKML